MRTLKVNVVARKKVQRHAILSFVVLVSLFATGYPAQANATRFTGDDVLKYCVSSKPNQTANPGYDQDMTVYCWANFHATLATALMLVGDKQICLPKGTASTDVLFAAVNYLKSHPEDRGETASSIYVVVMKLQWPCHK